MLCHLRSLQSALIQPVQLLLHRLIRQISEAAVAMLHRFHHEKISKLRVLGQDGTMHIRANHVVLLCTLRLILSVVPLA